MVRPLLSFRPVGLRIAGPLLWASLLSVAVASPEVSAQGVVAQATGGTGAVTTDQSFPLHLTSTLSSSMSSGWLSPGYTRQPDLSQSLSVLPSAKLPTVAGLPAANLVGRMDVSIQWLGNLQTTVAERIPRISDFSLILNVPTLWQEEFTGIRIGTNLSARAPLSVTSRRWNVLGTVGANLPVNWSTGRFGWPVGVFFVSYVPSFNYIQHLVPNPTVSCFGANIAEPVIRTGAPADQLDRLPLVINRPGEIAANGECIIPGRRPIATLTQSGTAGWSLGKHTVIVSAAYSNQFLAPLNGDPALSSPYESGQYFTEFTSGTIAYAYSIPSGALGLPDNAFASITMGLSSFQPAWNAKGDALRFPFWDFVTPANNFSAAFLDFNIGI